MDSMRSLNTSLPQSKRNQPSSDLLQAFKAAALSVTQLYKTAASEDVTASEARNAGYQDALDHLLTFLDQNNLGLGDGEGWQVRRWATQRLATSQAETDAPMDTDDDKRTRSMSPVLQHKPSPEPAPHTPSPTRADSSPPATQPYIFTAHSDRPDVFHFRAAQPLPTDPDPSTDRPEPVRGVLPRHVRGPTSRHAHSTLSRTPATLLGLGHGAGAKRKNIFSDFFDISDVGREGHRGGKKGRFG